MNRRAWITTVGGWLSASIALAQDAPAPEAPAPAPATPAPANIIPSGFRGFVVIDNRYLGKDDPVTNRNRKGKLHCPVCEFGLNPSVLVIARKLPTGADDPVTNLLIQLDRLGVQFKSSRFGVASIFLTLDKNIEDDDYRDLKIAEAEKSLTDAKLQASQVLISESTIEAQGAPQVAPSVKAFQIDDADGVTVIFYNRLKVINRWTFANSTEVTSEKVQTITDAVKTLLTPKSRPRPTLILTQPNG
ncbi:hypothetical protein [Tuwongella immobilis]|uniref:Secreted protein n=1 Tax=Tuwongella immobilis TaxID=692036 RepID=A0A6C2YS06_9BACT|nr:hypothetical protein [Tuwongella immobilis]VIP04134.1 unnamed protein product [Tuwongella immobilis]VTS05633.1 unnamed protein product [Tuwongella immobilis]